MKNYPQTPYDATITVIVATEAFSDLPWPTLTAEQKRGVLVLYDALMAKAEPLLPQTPEMQHVRTAIARTREIANMVHNLNITKTLGDRYHYPED